MNKEYRINDKISDPVIDLVMPNGEMKRGVTKDQAMTIALEHELDLVEMTPPRNGRLSVCKILNFGKLQYENSKKMKQPKSHSLKEIKWGYKISDHDLSIKNKKVKELLEKKHKVRYSVNLVGREKHMVEDAINKMKQNLDLFNNIAKIEGPKVSSGYGQISISSVLSPI